MRGELRSQIEPVLTEEIAAGPLSGVINPSQACSVWNDFLRGKTSWTRPWSLFVLHRWCELHAVTG